MSVRYQVTEVDLSSWSTGPVNPYEEHALASHLPHGSDCPCLMCADQRRAYEMVRLVLPLETLARRARERYDGVEILLEGAGVVDC